MFDFDKFYRGLLEKAKHFNPYDDYWSQFPSGMHLKFKPETLALLKANVRNRDANGLSCILAIICHDGADKDYTDILLSLLDDHWHTAEEDIVEALEIIKDPKSIDKLYDVAIKVPDYDDMRSLARKCMYALSAINTPEAIAKLELLQGSNDPIIKENATFQLEQVVNKN